jgi:hypothetical protein
MGIDWFRCKIKPDVDRALLDRLIEQQAVAFHEFRQRAFYDWLQEFFQWTDRCIALNFGFYLDY